ncbi:hypothetical protein MYCTH_2311517, partial [Thermothelomyces thermophilus ATCC 42464]
MHAPFIGSNLLPASHFLSFFFTPYLGAYSGVLGLERVAERDRVARGGCNKENEYDCAM